MQSSLTGHLQAFLLTGICDSWPQAPLFVLRRNNKNQNLDIMLLFLFLVSNRVLSLALVHGSNLYLPTLALNLYLNITALNWYLPALVN